MPSTLDEATRLVNHGLAILPIPHGHTSPRFDWTHYQRRAPSLRELDDWLENNVGIGAICGRISRNLVAVEFASGKAYLHWKAANPKMAAKLPTISYEDVDTVLFRTGNTTPSGNLFLPGFPGRAGRILGEGSIVPLPPTLTSMANDRVWTIPLAKENFPTFYTLDDPGVMFRPLPSESKSNTQTPQYLNTAPVEQDADKYAHLFQSAENYEAQDEYKERKWVVEGLLPETYLAILAGDSKSGKSCLLTALSMAITKGQNFLGLETAYSAVLWLAYEESPIERREALDAFPKPHGGFYVSHEKLHIDTFEGLEALRWWVRNTNAKLIVIDPLYAATATESLSDGRSARNCLTGLKELCRTEGCAAIVLHHFNKDTSSGLSRERFADSNQLVAAASMDILMDHRQIATGREITLRCRGRGDFANQTWVIASSGIGDYRLLAHGTDAVVGAKMRAEMILAPVRDAKEPISGDEIAEVTGLNRKTVANQLAGLRRAGLVRVVGKEANAKLYELGEGLGE